MVQRHRSHLTDAMSKLGEALKCAVHNAANSMQKFKVSNSNLAQAFSAARLLFVMYRVAADNAVQLQRLLQHWQAHCVGAAAEKRHWLSLGRPPTNQCTLLPSCPPALLTTCAGRFALVSRGHSLRVGTARAAVRGPRKQLTDQLVRRKLAVGRRGRIMKQSL